MRQNSLLVIVLMQFVFCSVSIAQVAYEGFGSGVTGGAGGSIYTVTNLNNSGAGSLREAVNGSNRIVQFSVGGTINLSSPIYIEGANITVDGLTAPSAITLSGQGFVIAGQQYSGPDSTHGANIIVGGVRVRSAAEDGFQIAFNAHDVVVDHCSIANYGDGGIDITEGAYNVTVSWNIIGPGDASGASLLAYDASRVSYHHNIFYQNSGNGRNPLVEAMTARGYSSGPVHTPPDMDVRYNLIWAFHIGTYLDHEGSVPAQGNVASNLYNTVSEYARNGIVPVPRPDYPAQAYVAGNVSIPDPRDCAYTSEETPCMQITSTNSPNNHAAFVTPVITGPLPTDNQGRLDTWTNVKNQAGLISKFSDDSSDAAVRANITLPGLSIFTTAWNNDASLYGDVSENGAVTAYDASLAAQYGVGLITLTSTQITKADVSGNGSVTSYDASLIAQYVVGLITKFPVEG